MKKSILMVGALLVLGASAASAAGINLSWDDCGTAGTQNKTFACNSNAGAPFTAVASFDPPAGVNEFIGLEAQMDITTDQAPGSLPDWWKHGSGQCRGTTGLSASFDFTTGPFGPCIDVFAGGASGGFSYDVGFGSPGRARLRVLCAVPAENASVVDPGTEYYGFKINFLRPKTTGAGNCVGCTNSACIVLNEIKLVQPFAAGNDPQLFNPRERNWITWQSPATGPPGCPLTTATQSKTWGQVKSLYR